MKRIALTVTLAWLTLLSIAQDISPVTVDIRNNPKLEWNGFAVKRKLIVHQFLPIYDKSKDFVVRGIIINYANDNGNYGAKITDLITNDESLSPEERADLLDRYADKEISYTTANKWVDSNGNLVPEGTQGAIKEILYWQNFKVNQIPNTTSASTQGALDLIYKTLVALITKLDARKNF